MKSLYKIVTNLLVENEYELNNSLNEYAEKVIKTLIEKFKKENSHLTDEQILYYINRFEQLKNSPRVTEKDIMKYSFSDLEKLVDGVKSNDKVSKNKNDVIFSESELIYNQFPLQIFHAHEGAKSCIKIKGDFPATWCVARTSGNLYNNYRYGKNSSFYFVKNLERLNKIKELEDDPYCFFVIQVLDDGFEITSALNNNDESVTWNDIEDIEPLLKGKESYFKHIPLTNDEKIYYAKFKNGIGIEMYKSLSYKEKEIYLSIRNSLTDEEFENTPIEIQNNYITMGATLSNAQFELIEDKNKLLNNYRRVTLNSIVPLWIKGKVKLENRVNVLSLKDCIKIIDDVVEKKIQPYDLYEITKKYPILVPYTFEHHREYFKNLFYLDELDEDFVETHHQYFLDNYDIDNLLYKIPTLIEFIPENDIGKLSQHTLINILIKNSKYLEKVKKYTNKISNHNIDQILIAQPSLIDYFKNRLPDIPSFNVAKILKKQPSLIDYFKNNIPHLDSVYVVRIIIAHPSLMDYFEENIPKLDFRDYFHLLNAHKSFYKKFEPYINASFEKKSNFDKKFSIVDVLKSFPKIIKFIIPYIKYVPNADIPQLISNNPSLIKYFKHRLYKLNGDEIENLLLSLDDRYIDSVINNVDLKQLRGGAKSIIYYQGKYNDDGDEIEPDSEEDVNKIKYLLSQKPQLKPYFKKAGILNESLDSPNIINEFIKFCKQEIGFQTHPIVTFTKKKENTKTLGHNDLSNNRIMVYIQDRLMADVMRTLAHEFVHTKQKDLNVLNADSGKDGSEHENEANSKAGEILRKFGKKFPEIYSQKFPVNAYKNTYLDNKILKESDGVYEYGCLMLKLNINNWKEVIGKINDDDLYMSEENGGYGKEKNPHVTILYGFLPTTKYSDVEKVLSKLKKPIIVTINQLSLFKNQEYDVLKYNVSGKILHSLNKLFSEKFENENKFTEYIPHCTVAYIIKGQGSKYITPISPCKVSCDEFIYSFPNGEKKTFRINNNV